MEDVDLDGVVVGCLEVDLWLRLAHWIEGRCSPFFKNRKQDHGGASTS